MSKGKALGDGRLRELIASYLEEVKLMQLATSVDDQPWVCSVWFAADEDLNVYWFSANNRRHSLEVDQNSRVAAAFALPNQLPTDPPRGLQLQGTASIVAEWSDLDAARAVYAGRIFTDERITALMNHAERPHRFYKIEPTQFVLFDAVNFPDDPRQQLDL